MALRAFAGPVRALGSALERFGAAVQADKAYNEILTRHREVMGFGGKKASIASDSFVAPSANVVGDVTIGPRSAVWYGAVVLGDAGKVSVGSMTQIKDRAVVSSNAVIGSNVVIGIGSVIGEGAKVGDGSSIGMGSTLESGVVVEAGAAVAPGSVVAAGTSVTAGQLFSGSPAKALRPLTAEESSRLLAAASSLPSLAKVHKAENLKTFVEVEQDKSDVKWAYERNLDYDGSLGLLEKNPRAQVW